MAEATKAPPGDDWLTVREACALVGVSAGTLRRWSDEGHVEAFTTPGGHRRFARAAILALLPDSMSELRDGATIAAAGRDDGEPQGLLALATHARRVPSPAREAFAAELAALEPDPRTIVVHTCHRVEVYAAGAGDGAAGLPEPPPGTRRLQGADAARHLIGVACGLDSAVLGENQVLHQLRETLKRRRAEGRPLDPALDRLFQVSLHAGRRARSWLDGTRQSLADVALELVAARAGSLRGQPLLVVGAGAMGRLSATAAARREAEVLVTSRTDARAAALARQVGGRAIPFEGRDAVPDVAGALVALCGPWRVGESSARRLAAGDAVVIDMSSPPAVPEALQAQLGERFVSTDDLACESSFAPQGRLRRRLEQLVEESGDSYAGWLRSRQAVPAIKAIGEAADGQRRDELEWLFRRLPELPERDRALIEQMSNRLVAGLLHAPRTALNADRSGQLAAAARELFKT